MSGEHILSDGLQNRIENIEVDPQSGKVKVWLRIGGLLSIPVEKELIANGTQPGKFGIYRPERLRKQKPRVSGVSHEVVFAVSSSLLTEFDGKARTAEIVDADRVQTEETQVRKALDALGQKELIRFERAGREAYWIVEDWNSLFIYSVSDELEKEFNSYQDKMRWCRKNL